jgi:16S rRNA processing protein RimM
LTTDPELNLETAVTVGRITTAHGIRGEVKVEPLTDFSERFQRGSRLWLGGEPIVVERGRWQARNVILKLSGISSRNQAEALVGKELLAPEAMQLEDENVYYLHDIIGLTVVDVSGQKLGQLTDVFSTGANDVYVVKSERGELLLPALDDVIHQVDVKAGRIVVEVPEGLEFAKPAAPKTKRPPQIPGTDPGATKAPSG